MEKAFSPESLDAALWAAGADEAALSAYQAAFREEERRIAARGEDHRHRFVIVIPVADRPQHLEDCLDSLYRLCRAFEYGGFRENRYPKVSVMIADDSEDAGNIRRNRDIAAQCGARGIETVYFGLAEQLERLDALTQGQRDALARVLGCIDRAAFHHKGPSIVRNLAYLKLRELCRGEENALCYFIDSDQEFQVKIATSRGERNVYAVNYLYQLDRIFSATDAAIVTGKVVGDPPVSPAVMAGNFLLDVVGYLRAAAAAAPSAPCAFHAPPAGADDAAYHDMAALFGFAAGAEAYSYLCPLAGDHDNAACFGRFAAELRHFFYGEHPTRKTYYDHQDIMAGIRPARTVYTGNYVVRPEALRFFIPFATLKLRMAGPVLGRLLKAEIGGRFVSANLPMLHKRTVRATGQSEFRPGIAAETDRIDLSGEFERQFYGDVMLFAVEKLTALGLPRLTPPHEAIVAALEATHDGIAAQYHDKRQAIRANLADLAALLDDPAHWWNRSPAQAGVVARLKAFAANVERNFGERAPGYELVAANRTRRHAEMAAAISSLVIDREAWAELFRCAG